MGTWHVDITPVSSKSDKDTVLPDLAGSTSRGVFGSGAANSYSTSTILCICSSSLVSRISREEIDFLPELDWLTDSLYISWSWLETDSILWDSAIYVISLVKWMKQEKQAVETTLIQVDSQAFEQWDTQFVTQSGSQSVNQLVSQCVSPSVRSSFSKPVSSSVRQSVSQRLSQSDRDLVSQSVIQTLSQSVSHSDTQAVNQSVRDSVSQSVSQTDRPSVSQSVTQTLSQSVVRSVIRSIRLLVNIQCEEEHALRELSFSSNIEPLIILNNTRSSYISTWVLTCLLSLWFSPLEKREVMCLSPWGRNLHIALQTS